MSEGDICIIRDIFITFVSLKKKNQNTKNDEYIQENLHGSDFGTYARADCS